MNINMRTIKFAATFLLLLVFTAGMISACRVDGKPSGKEGENVVRQTRQVSAFSGIRAGGAFEVILKQGPVQEVIVEADQNIIDEISTTVSGGVLWIDLKKPVHLRYNDIKVMRVFITCNDLSLLDLSGAVELRTETRFTVPKLSMEVSGAVESRMELVAQELNMSISGSSELKFQGTAGNVKVDASGAAEISAYDMIMTNLTLYASGAVDANVNVSGSLKANVSGACDIKYKGNPKVECHTSGACDIARAE